MPADPGSKMQPGVCSLGDGALVTDPDWLWVLSERERERRQERVGGRGRRDAG